MVRTAAVDLVRVAGLLHHHGAGLHRFGSAEQTGADQYAAGIAANTATQSKLAVNAAAAAADAEVECDTDVQ